MADTDSTIKRIQPHDNDAERGLIGAMLIDRDAISDAAALLQKEDFYNAQYGLLFEAMVELYNEGKDIDEVILSERLRQKGAPDEISSLQYIGDILADIRTSAFAKNYAEIIRDKSYLRKLIRTMNELSGKAYENRESVDAILEESEDNIFRLVQSRNGSSDLVPIQKIVLDVINEIEEATRRDGRISGLRTGFTDLDNMLTGMHKGELLLVAARPSMGKTAFVLNIAHFVAVHEQIPVLMFSLEMSKEQLVTRLVSVDSMVDAKALRTGDINDEDWGRIIESTNTIARAPLFIDDNSSITVAELRSKCRKLKATENIGLIVIDYLQLMNSQRPVESRQQFISEVSRSLKGVARELQVPVIALSQLNRAVDARPEHRPVLADLRESGAIEQDADVVMFIYRDEYYNKDTEKPGVAEIIVAKQRNGSTGSVDLAWLGQYTKFANLAKNPPDQG